MTRLLTTFLLVAAIATQKTFAFSSSSWPSVRHVTRSTTTTIGRLHDVVEASHFHQVHHHLTKLHGAGDDDDKFAEAFQINLRKDRLTTKYKVTAIAYLLYALQNVRIQSKLSYACLLASGHLMASGLAYILSKASNRNHLSVFTSKRYNLALFGYGITQLLVITLAGKIPGGSLMILGPLLATISSIQGYTYGVRGWLYDKAPVGDIVGELKNTSCQILKSIVKVPKMNVQSIGYLSATLMLGGMKLMKFKEICEILIKAKGSSDVAASLLVPLARLGRLAMFSAVVYMLKDGSDRKLLDTPNMIQLNLLSAISFAALASYVGVSSTAVTPIGGAAAIFSIFCGVNGLISMLK